jgi:hypothetical protein
VLARLKRQGVISTRAYPAARNQLAQTLSTWRQIEPVDLVRETAIEQLGRFPLRAPDALQLGAALVWTRQKPRNRLFICNDLRLGTAAREAGFTVEEV